MIALRRGRLEEAELLALEASEMNQLEAAPSEADGGSNHPQPCENPPSAETIRGGRAEVTDAIAISETALGKKHPETAKAYLNLATFYQIRRRDRGAEQLYRRAIAIVSRSMARTMCWY